MIRYIAVIALSLGCGCMFVLSGCEATAKSDRMEPGWQKTASYEKIMATPATQPSPLVHRSWKISEANYTECVVTHFGSYFDDEFAKYGDGNDTLGWTDADILAAVYCPIRFVINTVCVPISMIKEPPGVLTTSYLDQPAEHYSTISKEEVLSDKRSDEQGQQVEGGEGSSGSKKSTDKSVKEKRQISAEADTN